MPRVIPAVSESVPDVDVLLAAAVQGIGGAERPGQVQMAEAVRHAIETGEHVAVQAGTGTGKSLAYLVPAVRHALTAAARSWWPPPPSPCSGSSSIATCRA